MTILFGNAGFQNTAGDAPALPGAAPVGATMQGNPQSAQLEPFGVLVPAPQNPVQQLTETQISNGNMPLQTQPTNVAAQPGTDSLMAQMSRGQVIMADSTYGQSGFIPQNGGCSPQAASPAANVSQPVLARVASAVTIPSPAVYTGN